MYELVSLGIWSYVIAHNSHQVEFAKNMERFGVINYMGDASNVDWEKLRETIQQEYGMKKIVSEKMIDGKGADRIAKRIYELCS